jgi:hypothetical protein
MFIRTKIAIVRRNEVERPMIVMDGRACGSYCMHHDSNHADRPSVGLSCCRGDFVDMLVEGYFGEMLNNDLQ